jgi:hypothetical protein
MSRLLTEMIKFRLLRMPCCGQLVCWVNPRWPNHCPECGTRIYPQIKEDAELCKVYDPDARLQIHR